MFLGGHKEVARPAYSPVAAGALCLVCPLRGRKVVPPEGPPDPELAFVGEGPGGQEEKRGRPFVGPSGLLLNELLRKAGVSRDRIWISNAVLCRADTPGVQGPKRFDFKTYLAYIRGLNKTAKAKERERAKAEGRKPAPVFEIPSPLDCCRPRLAAELKYFDQVAHARGDKHGLVVIPMGNYAALSITGKQKIMKLRGSPLEVTL